MVSCARYFVKTVGLLAIERIFRILNSAKSPLLTPLMRWFLLAMILANIAGTMTQLLTPIYLTRLGASVSQVGLVFTLTSLVILVLQVFGGWISDSIGRLRAIALGSLGGVTGFILMLLAPSWQWMLLALTINQIPYALVGPSFSAFIAENSSEENRGRVYGVTEMIYQVTGIVGPPLGGFLAGRAGFKTMLLAATLFYTLAAILRVWMARTMRSSGESEPRQLSLANFKQSLGLIWTMLAGGSVYTPGEATAPATCTRTGDAVGAGLGAAVGGGTICTPPGAGHRAARKASPATSALDRNTRTQVRRLLNRSAMLPPVGSGQMDQASTGSR